MRPLKPIRVTHLTVCTFPDHDEGIVYEDSTENVNDEQLGICVDVWLSISMQVFLSSNGLAGNCDMTRSKLSQSKSPSEIGRALRNPCLRALSTQTHQSGPCSTGD